MRLTTILSKKLLRSPLVSFMKQRHPQPELPSTTLDRRKRHSLHEPGRAKAEIASIFEAEEGPVEHDDPHRIVERDGRERVRVLLLVSKLLEAEEVSGPISACENRPMVRKLT